MTGASWGVSVAGLIVWVACWLLLRHYRHLHEVTHPIAVRLAIGFSYVAGCAVALTALGGYAVRVLEWMLSPVGGPYAGLGHFLVTGTGLALAVTVGVALIWTPLAAYAYVAAFTPLVLAVDGGHLHGLLQVIPAAQVVTVISHWIGG